MAHPQEAKGKRGRSWKVSGNLQRSKLTKRQKQNGSMRKAGGRHEGQQPSRKPHSPHSKKLVQCPTVNEPDTTHEDGGSEEVVDSSEGEEYERRPRHLREEKEVVDTLPFKSVTGEVIYRNGTERRKLDTPQLRGVAGVTIEDDGALDDEESVEPVVSDDDEDGFQEEEALKEEPEDEDDDADMQELQEFEDSEERREELKQQVAVAATQLLQNPEENLANLRTLLALAADKDAQVAKLAMLSLTAVFRDILPGYRIRLPTDKELAMPVSKDVKMVRDHESALLSQYQAFLKGLLRGAQGHRGMPVARAAVKCMATLLHSRFTFNFASDLLQAVVPRMTHRDPVISQLCCAAVKTVLEHDLEGAAAKEAVQLIADLVKKKKCLCPPDVVGILVSLNLREAETANVKATGLSKKQSGKKARKKSKRKKDGVAADFEEAAATPDAVALKQQQSDTLEVLFEIFFRVLKQTAASGLTALEWKGPPISEAHAGKKFPLLPPSLRGLVHFSRMLSVEYFADILKVLLDIIRAPGLPLRTRLECLMAASNTHRAQGEALTVDRRSLYEAFFDMLLPLPLEPLLGDDWSIGGAASLGGFDKSSAAVPGSDEQGQQQPQSAAPEMSVGQLMTRLAVQMLLDQARLMQIDRLAAFAKRMAGVALQLEPGAGMGLLAVVDRMLRRNQKLRFLIDNENGPMPAGSRQEEDDSLEGAAECSKRTTLWELTCCRVSAHPHMPLAAASILAIPLEGSTGLSHQVLSHQNGPEGIAAKYSSLRGGIHPLPQLPKAGAAAKRPLHSRSTVQFEKLTQHADRHAGSGQPSFKLQPRRFRGRQ